MRSHICWQQSRHCDGELWRIQFTSQAMLSMPPTPSPPPMSSTVLRPASVAKPSCFRNLLLSVVAAGFQNAGRTGKPRNITCCHVCMYVDCKSMYVTVRRVFGWIDSPCWQARYCARRSAWLLPRARSTVTKWVSYKWMQTNIVNQSFRSDKIIN